MPRQPVQSFFASLPLCLRASVANFRRTIEFPRPSLRRQRQTERPLQRRAHRDHAEIGVREILKHPAEFPYRRSHRAHDIDSIRHVFQDVNTALFGARNGLELVPPPPKPRGILDWGSKHSSLEVL